MSQLVPGPLQPPASCVSCFHSFVSCNPGACYKIAQDTLAPLYSVAEQTIPPIAKAISGPILIASSAAALIKAKVLEDSEAELDAKLKLVGTPFSIGSNALYLFSVSIRLLGLIKYTISACFNKTLAIVGFPMAGLGIASSIVEGFTESLNLRRVSSLLNKVNLTFDADGNQHETLLIKNLESLTNYGTAPTKEESEKIETLCQETDPTLRTEALEKLHEALLGLKKEKLIRRVGERCTERILTEAPFLLDQLRNNHNPDERRSALAQANELLKDIKIQTQKKILIHTLGLLVCILYGIGFLAALLSCPPLAVSLLFMIGTIFMVGKYLLNSGVLEEKGWDFSLEKCIPEGVRSAYKKLEEWFKSCEQRSSESK